MKVDCYLMSLSTHHITMICLKSTYTILAGEFFGRDILQHDIFILEDPDHGSEAEHDVGA